MKYVPGDLYKIVDKEFCAYDASDKFYLNGARWFPKDSIVFIVSHGKIRRWSSSASDLNMAEVVFIYDNKKYKFSYDPTGSHSALEKINE